MPDFAYKAVRGSGQMVEGVMAAESESSLLETLREMGCLPIQVSPKQASPGLLFLKRGRQGLSSRNRLEFARQMATLVRAAVPLDRSLALCRDLAEGQKSKEVIENILSELRSGKSLAESLSAVGNFFPPLYVAMVRAGEASGTLPVVLDRLVEFEEFNEELRNFLLAALIYPALLVTAGGAAIALLLGFVVPRFAQVFAEAGKELPLPTWILMQVAEGFRQYGWLAAAALVAAVWLGRGWVRTESGRLRWDRWKLRVPLVGAVELKLQMARFSKTLGTLLAQTVPIVAAMRLTREVLGNRILAATIEPLIQGIKRGQGLATPMKEAGLYPALAVQLATLGEQTGRLDLMLLQVAEIYEREVRAATKRLVALIEPAIILVMGLIVGSIVISTLLAIVSINEVPF